MYLHLTVEITESKKQIGMITKRTKYSDHVHKGLFSILFYIEKPDCPVQTIFFTIRLSMNYNVLTNILFINFHSKVMFIRQLIFS